MARCVLFAVLVLGAVLDRVLAQSGGFGPKFIITYAAGQARDVFVADLNGDGHVDVLSASTSDSRIAWYANDGLGGLSSPRIIAASPASAMWMWYVTAADLDNDGDIDVLRSGEADNLLAWYRNNGTGSFTAKIPLGVVGRMFVRDIDGDGDNDIVKGAYSENRVVWYRNTNGAGLFTTELVIGTDLFGVNSVSGADFDLDGDIDVISTSSTDGKVSLFWNNGTGVFAPASVLAFATGVGAGVAADVNLDGAVDIVASDSSGIFWLMNNGTGNFSSRRFVGAETSVTKIQIIDMDLDGRNDILCSTYSNRLVWRRNTGAEVFSTGDLITQDSLLSPASLYAADLDGDGDPDVVSPSFHDGAIVWYRNWICPAFAAPVGGNVSSTLYAVAPESRLFSCGPGLGLVGSANLTCQAVGGWPSGPPVCRSATCPSVASQASVSFAPSVIVAASLRLSVTTRSSSGAQVECADALSVTIDGLAVPVSISRPSAAIYFVDVQAPTVPGQHDIGVLVNGQLGSTTPVTVLTGPVWPQRTLFNGLSIADIELSGLKLVVTPIIPETNLTITLRDQFGNQALGGDTVSVRLVQSGLSVGSPPVLASQRPGSYETLFSVLGTFSMEVTINGAAQIGPFFVQVAEFCVPGFFQLSGGACRRCDEGTFSNVSNADGCFKCPSGGTTSDSILATAINNCTCLRDLFAPLGPGTPCVDCPRHATCAGGRDAPRPIAGFAATDSTSSNFAACPRSASCLGGGLGCAAGYTGFLCKDCRSGFFADADGECRPCPTASKGLLAIFVVLVVVLSIATVVVVLCSLSKASTNESGSGSDVVLRTRRFPPSIALVITAFQIVGVLSVANFAWPSGARRALGAFSVASLDVNLFASECSLVSFEAKYATALLSPAVFACLVVVELLLVNLAQTHVVRALSIDRLPGLSQQLLAALFLLGPIAYLPLSRSALVLLDCTRLADKRYYLDADMTVECFSARWRALLPLALFGIFAYVIAVPGIISATLMAHRNQLFNDASVVRAYGSLYKLFRRPYVAMPLFLLAKKLGIACCSLFLSRLQGFQIAGFLLLILVSGLVQLHLEPYFYPVYDRIELVFTGLLSIILVAGMVSGYSADPNAQVSALAITVIVLGCVCALALAAILFVAQDIRSITQERRALRNGESRDNNAHARRLRALALSNLRDLEDPDTFLSSLQQSEKSSATRPSRALTLDTVSLETIEMAELGTE